MILLQLHNKIRASDAQKKDGGKATVNKTTKLQLGNLV